MRDGAGGRAGREFAQWYVYRSTWFIGILALLGVNLLAATLVRFPWRRNQVGFVVTHAGLLVLLVGSIQTFVAGIEGQVALQEGKQAEHMVVSDRSVVSITRPASRGQVQTQLTFEPGPADWPEGTVLDFGNADGVGLKVLRFLAHARVQKQWVPDKSLGTWPAIQLQLCGPTGQPLAEEWLTGNLFGGDVILSSTRYELLPIPVESMLQDFLEPPVEDLGKAGVLSVHCDGKLQRLRWTSNWGNEWRWATRERRWSSSNISQTPSRLLREVSARRAKWRRTRCWS